MGEIISSKVTDEGKILFTISLNRDEALQLQGHVNNVYLFSENVASYKTNIAARGKNEATKYFLIPRSLRQDLKFTNEVACHRIDTKEKTIFLYMIDKFRMNNKHGDLSKFTENNHT